MIADAAGLGRITVFSALGQPLRAEIEVNASKDELPGMAARIASPESFRQAGLEYAGALSAIKVSLDKRPSGQPVIKLSSDRPLSEPFVDMLLELNWSAGRLVREYTFLLDPPEVGREAPGSVPVAAPKAPEKAADKVVEKPVEKAAEKVAEKPSEKPVEKAPAQAEKKAEKKSVEAAETPAQRAVKSGDTLSRIAGEVKPEGVALEQMLVGLFRANPDAFQDGNMNRLKRGKILAVPSKETVEGISVAEARKEVLAQAQDWNAYRRKLAGMTAQEPVTDTPAQKESSGKITAKVEDKAPAPAETKDQVKVSKSQTAGAQAPAAKMASAEEEKIAREKALKESAERAAQLEKNVADLQKLAELKNKQLAQAQVAAKPAEPVKPAEPAKVEPAKPVEAASTPAPAVPPAATAAAPAPAQPSADVKPAEAAKPADAPKPKPKAPPPPPVEEEEESLFSPALLGGLATLVAGIGGLIFYRRRKASQAGEVPVVTPSLGEPSLGANSVFRATGGQSIDTSAATPAVTDFSQTGPGTIDTDEVDPVAEAEVYMAYGRDAQAEEILLEALQKDGKRLAIHLKLLEIYAQRKSTKQFETLATELYAQTGGNGPEWEKAVAMGSKLDPANPLYASGNAAPASPFGVAAVAGATAAVAATAATAFDPDATLATNDLGESTHLNPGGFAQIAESVTESVSESISDSVSEPAPAAPVVDDNKLAFDLDIGDLPSFGETPAAASEPFSPSDTLVKGAAPDEAPAVADGLALDFDLDLGAPATTGAAAPAAAVPDLDLGAGLDFDLKLGDSQIDAGVPSEPVNKPDLSSISLDLGAPADSGVMDFEKTLLATPEMADAMATNILSGGAAASLSESVSAGGAAEQAVATKLDLAKAYEEMGDAEGARELLQEVLAEGTPAQQEAANAMLARLG